MIAWSLTAISIFWGLAARFVFRRFTDHAPLRKTLRHLYAHLLELRLYSEEPALVWSAQKALIVDNLRFIALVAKPALIMALPFACLYGQLDSIYGWGPLEIGHSATVTLQFPGEAGFALETPTGIAVETPPVAIPAEHQISWRIRPLSSVRGNLRFTHPGDDIMSAVAAGERTVSPYRRRQSLPGGFAVDVDYPKAEVAIAGLELPWLAWFLIISSASAALFGLTRPSARAHHPPTTRPSPAA